MIDFYIQFHPVAIEQSGPSLLVLFASRFVGRAKILAK